MSAPCSRAAASTASRSASSPVADWTALNATAVVRPSIASASRSSGTVSTSTPRCACARNGKSSEVKSISGATTRAPSGIAAATWPTSPETVAPVATRSGGTPTSRAHASRARAVLSPHGSQVVRPSRQSASAACSSSQAGCGGSP